MYESVMKEAWALWQSKLGEASQKNGHRLQVKEFEYWGNEWPYCFKERDGDVPWVWNSYVGYSVVVVQALPLSYAWGWALFNSWLCAPKVAEPQERTWQTQHHFQPWRLLS